MQAIGISYTLKKEPNDYEHSSFIGSFLPNASGRKLCSGTSQIISTDYTSTVIEDSDIILKKLLSTINSFYTTNYNSDWFSNSYNNHANKLIIQYYIDDIMNSKTISRQTKAHAEVLKKTRGKIYDIQRPMYYDNDWYYNPIDNYLELMRIVEARPTIWTDLAKKRISCIKTKNIWNIETEINTYEYDLSKLYAKTKKIFEVKKEVSA